MFEALDLITEALLPYKPHKIILFGSQARGTATDKSDVDICVVIDTQKKHALTTELYLALDLEAPVDIIVYTPTEWESCLSDRTSFAYKINTEGVVLYG